MFDFQNIFFITSRFDDDEGGKPQGVKEIVLGGKKSKSKTKSTNIFDRVLRPPQLGMFAAILPDALFTMTNSGFSPFL
jgi:hypothetical protein